MSRLGLSYPDWAGVSQDELVLAMRMYNGSVCAVGEGTALVLTMCGYNSM